MKIIILDGNNLNMNYVYFFLVCLLECYVESKQKEILETILFETLFHSIFANGIHMTTKKLRNIF